MEEYGSLTRPDGIFDEAHRRPTDKYWLIPLGIGFVLYVICCGLSLSLTTDQPLQLLNNRSTGFVCGADSSVLDRPYKIYLDQRDCLKHNSEELVLNCREPHICVKDCPEGKFDIGTCQDSNIEQVKKQLLCDSDQTLKSIRSCDDIKRRNCVKWYNDADSFLGLCDSDTESPRDAGQWDVLSSMYAMIVPFLIATILAVVLSSIFIFTLKWSAGCVFWSFIGFLASFFVAAIIGLGYGIATYGNTEKEGKQDGVGGLIVALVIVIIFFLAFVAFLYFCRRKIRCGIELVKESSRAVCASMTTIFFPLLPYLSRAFFIIFTIVVVVKACLIFDYKYKVFGSPSDCACSVSYSYGDVCTPKQFNNDCKDASGGVCSSLYCGLDDQVETWYPKIIMAIVAFTALWIVAFIQANVKMILAHVYGNWWWSWNKSTIPSGALSNAVVKVFRNHTGTAAFGSLIITICRVLKSLLNSKNNSSNRGVGAIIAAVISAIVRVFASAMLELVEFISDKSFVMCAILGTDFWNSVKGVSKIMLKDIPLVVATESVGNIILGVCKFLVAVLSSVVFLACAPLDKDEDVYLTIGFTTLVFIFVYDLASTLLISYDVAIDTLLVCALQDYVHSRAEKSYFQSDSLNELLIKPAAA